MSKNNPIEVVQMNYFSPSRLCLIAIVLTSIALACSTRDRRRPRIAVVPRTTGVMLWEAERDGATAAAAKHGFDIYWNAPTREDDVEGQIALLDRIRGQNFAGLVLAPDQGLALMTSVRKALAAHVPTVIVSSPLPLAPQSGLSYILNDDQETGRLAARRLGQVLNRKGTVGLLSLDPNLLGLTAQVRSFEETLSAEFPDVQIVDRRLGAFNGAEVQQITADVLDKFPSLNALVSFTAVATRGAFLVLRKRDQSRRIKLIGCEQEADIIEAVAHGEIDALVAQNSYQMGYKAIESIALSRQNLKVVEKAWLPPLLITKENINSPHIRDAVNFGLSEPMRPGVP